MTRINVVPVKELCNQHLFAEWREMPRLVGNLNKSLSRQVPFSMEEIPDAYLLGQGHVKFFYNKFAWLYNRHREITEVLLAKGYNIQADSEIFRSVEPKWFNDWVPTEDALRLNRQRINEKMPHTPKWGNV
jgi:deoxyribonuclease (pyrimidine dimer)